MQYLLKLIAFQSIPLSLRQMFNQYFQLGSRLRRHYLSPDVLLCLLTGQFVPPIHRKDLYSLQYSMLPAQRAEIGEVWKRLNETRSKNHISFPQMNGMVKVPNGANINNRRSTRRTDRYTSIPP
jgi:phosphatidylinositol N-acetylglucosaminyltransferase subunit Q